MAVAIFLLVLGAVKLADVAANAPADARTDDVFRSRNPAPATIPPAMRAI